MSPLNWLFVLCLVEAAIILLLLGVIATPDYTDNDEEVNDDEMAVHDLRSRRY